MSERRLLLASGTYIDLSEYLLKSEAETLYAPLDEILNKQDKLISGTNIKTINNQNILGSGNITIDVGSSLTESDIAAMGFTKNTGTYSKPSSGIPKSDLASAVQTSLGKADTALQSYTEQYKGTITGVSANGTSVATSGVANIPAASTSVYGVTKLSSATNSTSTTLAATASAVKAAYDLANSYKGTVTGIKINGTTKSQSNGIVDLGTVITSHQDISGKQDKLVSGTNIKTINGTSILGSGNIEISGGSSGGSGAYSEVNHGTSDTTFTLTPNTFHIWDEVSALTLTLGSETAGVANEFLFQFTSGSEPTTLTMPDDIKWTEELVIETNRIYQISILKGLASTLNWKVEPSIVFPITLEMGDNGDIGISLYSYLQSTYGEPTSGTTLNEEIINNSQGGIAFETIEYATYMGLTGYWLNGYGPYKVSWVLLEDGYLQRLLPAQENPELP